CGGQLASNGRGLLGAFRDALTFLRELRVERGIARPFILEGMLQFLYAAPGRLGFGRARFDSSLSAGELALKRRDCVREPRRGVTLLCELRVARGDTRPLILQRPLERFDLTARRSRGFDRGLEFLFRLLE